MSRMLRDERGGVLALSAILIPVFLVLGAFVVDVGQWYTHKRQLQNRADAAAFAAGIEYAKNWRACVQTSDPTAQANAARTIANAARQYAADPEAADYAPDALPSPLFNANIANQGKLDVIVNSWNYTNNNDYSDDQPGIDADPVGDTTPGDPCFLHAGDAISPAGGHWTDVRVRENDLPSLFGSIGLPLSRNTARARIEIRPALSGHRFLPLAIPDNIITKVQVRYIDGCTGTELARHDLAQLPDTEYAAYASSGGGTLWALPNAGDPSVGDRNRSFDLPLSAFDPTECPGQYRPITEQVRVASTPDIDIDTPSCTTLRTNVSFADCFERLSQIRVWNDGNADSQPRIKDVRIVGGCPSPSDSYFGTLPLGATTCPYDVSVDVDWGTRDEPPNDVDDNFDVRANGTRLSLVSWDTNDVATYASSGGAFDADPGPNDVSISVAWEDDDPTHSWAGDPCINPPGPAGNPCVWATSEEVAHRTFVGLDSSDTTDPAATGVVEFVHTSLAPVDGSGAPGPSFDNWYPDDPDCATSPCPVYPTIGIRSALRTGVLVTLRTEDSQGSQLLRCDPAVPNGQELTLFANGCEPWYAKNGFENATPPEPSWWSTSTHLCPESTDWFYLPNPPATDPYTNSSLNPWKCVLQAPGSSTGQSGDWMAVATENCTQQNLGGTQCQTFKPAATANCGNYDGKPSDANGWLQQGGDSGDPRVVSLFIVPYQSLKGVGGSGTADEIPVLGFASFYVMNWEAQNNAESDPCPDPDFNGVNVNPPGRGTVLGVFVETVDYETGPVDPNAICQVGQLTPCRASLVR